MYHSVSLYLCIIFSDTELDSILQICLEIKLVDWFLYHTQLIEPESYFQKLLCNTTLLAQNYVETENFHARKLGEITVFYATQVIS